MGVLIRKSDRPDLYVKVYKAHCCANVVTGPQRLPERVRTAVGLKHNLN